MATNQCDRSTELNARCAILAYEHYNERNFEALSACLAGVVTSFRPELPFCDEKAIATMHRDAFVAHQRMRRDAAGAVKALELCASPWVIVAVLELDDGKLASNTLQFTKDNLIERSFMRRSLMRSRRDLPIDLFGKPDRHAHRHGLPNAALPLKMPISRGEANANIFDRSKVSSLFSIPSALH